LSSFRGSKPVVLIFGSYTCGPFRRKIPALNRMYRQYKNNVQFFLIYIQEAHASDAWQTKTNLRERVIVPSPKSYEERAGVAASCAAHLRIDMPILIDDFENSTERRYHAWPDRIYVIDRDGRVAYKGKTGPAGFKPDEAEKALRLIVRGSAAEQ